MHHFCGLDFGTSNSTIGVLKTGKALMVPLENNKPTLRSAIFFDFDSGNYLFGQVGIDHYLSGTPGRLMMSLKSVLGSSLMHEKTLINGKAVSFTDILGSLLRHIKFKAEEFIEQDLDHVILGRPVRFNDDDDKKDKLAQDTLEKIAKNQGFKQILFQYEPIAAALAYEQTLTQEKLALIIDLGGGTSDFSVIRLRPGINAQDRAKDVLANKGIHIGGTDFDAKLSLKTIMPELGLGGRMHSMSGTIQIPNSYYHDLTTWHTINSLYNHKTKQHLKDIYNHALKKEPIKKLMHVIETQQGHKILNTIEQSKCFLSHNVLTSLDLNFIEKNYCIDVTRDIFEESIQEKVDQLIQTLLATVTEANVRVENIDSVFFTGGSTQIPLIRQSIANLFPAAEMVKGDVFSSVGKGLIIDAAKRFS